MERTSRKFVNSMETLFSFKPLPGCEVEWRFVHSFLSFESRFNLAVCFSQNILTTQQQKVLKTSVCIAHGDGKLCHTPGCATFTKKWDSCFCFFCFCLVEKEK